jgi:exopolysaccharide/PEP-CTERM locus tyrosine autokinase
MGKISDALDRASKDKIINLGDRPKEEPRRLVLEDPETAYAKDICRIYECTEQLVVLSSPESADAEYFKLLRAQILFARDRQRPRTILVTSTFPGEGKTFISANLAASISLGIDENVLLVDADLRSPSIHDILSHPNGEGLHEYLTGEKSLQDLIVRTEIDKLSILTAGKVPSNPSELLSSTAMLNFLKEVRERYQDRLIIIDSSPCHITAEAKILAEYVDGIILVVMAQKTPRKTIQRAIDDFRKEKILGIVFNGYNPVRKSYKKYYEKYYQGSRNYASTFS